ncbi:MAG TPA: hypothetical protein VMS60_15640 [Solirubrobacterales bacterium]|nr:hypothetical protein [Solirubrobacterales bacterium]
MFDLSKDLDSYKGIPPYASELYGVYQPLLGWQSALTKEWVRTNSVGAPTRTRRILDGWIAPGPTGFSGDKEMQAEPLEPGHGRSPWKVVLLRDLDSLVLRYERQRLEGWVQEQEGRLPVGVEWNEVFEVNHMIDTLMPAVDRAIREEVFAPVAMMVDSDKLNALYLERIQYESQIAAMLLFYAETANPPDLDPDRLGSLFAVVSPPELDELLVPRDALEAIDPRDTGGALAPVGLVHTFRQWFFDLGHFDGEPVEHVWLAPGTTIELVEISTRRQLIEQQTETLVEATSRAESQETSRDELADAVKDENSNSTKLGVATTNTVKLGVYEGNVSANFGLDSTRKQAREKTHRMTREQSQKLATEIRKSTKSMFRTVTETTDTRSKRYLLQNTSGKLVNYELRRKMRRVGVQLQDLGTRLCWQVFVDDPGAPLGLSELVHFAPSPDLSSLKAPDEPPQPGPIVKRVVLPLPFKPILSYTNINHRYEFEGLDPNGRGFLGHVADDDDDDDSQIIIEFRGFKFDPPQAGYELGEVRMIGTQAGKLAVLREVRNMNPDGAFDLVFNTMHFGGESQINLEVDLVFAPNQTAFDAVGKTYADAKASFDAEREQKLREAYMDAVRKRIEAAAAIDRRPAWDLREEERTVVYRKLIERLMLGTWKLQPGPERARIGHLRSELVRSIFDVEEMMYFVAPEWWMPRVHQAKLDHSADSKHQLTDADLVSWGGRTQRRPDNYEITEASAPARMGSSLGWLMELDGDNLRNAFLNAPWVKAVVPVRPGKEREALNWLRATEGHENDGWDLPYIGDDDPELIDKTVGEALETIADRLEKEHADAGGTLASDTVFEHGFSPLSGGFDAGAPPGSGFAQWLTVLPTDQIVASEYEPTSFETP